MNTTGKSSKQNIWKRLAVGSVVLVAALTLLAGVVLRFEPAKEEEQTKGDLVYSQVQTEAVVSEEKATRSFLNKPAPEPEEGDNRQVFRIIEVIPHDACSVFPYLVDWETEEGYDRNTPLGYDGILISAQFTGGEYNSGFNMFSYPDVPASKSRPFTYMEEKFKREYFDKLGDYNIAFASVYDRNRGGKWFRKTENEYQLVEEPYGYFEYVGEGKGLYYINTNLIAGIKDQWGNESTEGIHYEIQAVPREGSAAPGGYMYACNPAYYWSKSSQSGAKPDYEGKAVLGLTDYNYDLKFEASDDGKYTVDKIVCSLTGGEGYDYELKLKESAVTGWKGGFYFQKKGSYEVASYTQSGDGEYVRFADSKQTDGLEKNNSDLSAGYFLLDREGTYTGIPRYKVSFKEAGGNSGSYMAGEPASWEGEDYYFTYVGNGEGSYKVSFLYAPAATVRYKDSVVRVSTGQGSYALATTSTAGNGEPVYSKDIVEGAVCDYAEVITYIDAYTGIWGDAIDYSDYNGRKGVTIGSQGWSEQQVETGGWVFVPIEKAGDMKQTFLKDVETESAGKNSNTNSYFTPGDRIYVSGQKRPYRFYCRDGLQNNEWFKLLCYSSHPLDGDKPYSEMINGIGYDFDKTAQENLNDEMTRQLLNAFDGQYRIEIIQMTPERLTPEDVKSADLIYISNQEGINGMSLNWNAISGLLTDEELTECNFNTVCHFKEDQDISSDTLMTLYDECIYQRNRALIVCHSVISDEEGIHRNMTKLYYMMNFFDEALSWAYFMPDMYPDVAKDEYSRIRTPGDYLTATVDVCRGGEYGTFNSVFAEEESEETDSEAENADGEEEDESEYPQYYLEDWRVEYFKVWTTYDSSESVPGFEFQNDIAFWANKVQDGETKLTIAYYIDPMFMDATMKDNIWKILRNRKTDNSMLVVEITNGEMTGETIPRRVIYADEFDPESFDIRYKVMLLGTAKNPSVLQDITLTFEDGSLAGKGAVLEYNEENTNNVRHGFTVDGSLDGELNPSVTVRQVTVTATDSNGKTGSAEVYVIVREAFMLN